MVENDKNTPVIHIFYAFVTYRFCNFFDIYRLCDLCFYPIVTNLQKFLQSS